MHAKIQNKSHQNQKELREEIETSLGENGSRMIWFLSEPAQTDLAEQSLGEKPYG